MSLRELTCDELFEYWEAFIKSGNEMRVTIGDHWIEVKYNHYYKAYITVIGNNNNSKNETRIYFNLMSILLLVSSFVEKGHQPNFRLRWID